ncbi:MAG: MbcA/ParS/Xre antitoxin family protein [Planctomycetes bacterium]|jgi:hypothetical protein|nr:MbcA/ParS/Xre antitoxin family protein [Planctomycetota bacterium]
MLQPLLARRVVAAAKRFQDWEPWRQFNDQYLFAFELPGEPLPIYGIVLGAGGQSFGLSLYRGERALEQVHYVITEPRPPFVAPMLLLSFDPIGAVRDEQLDLVKAAGFTDRVIPIVISVAVGGHGHPPSNNELRLLAQVLEAMLRAADDELLRPRRIDLDVGGKVLTLVITGEKSKVHDVTVRFVDVPPLRGADAATGSLPWPLPELEPIDAQRLVGFAPAPFGINNEANRPWVLCVLDPERDRIAGLEVVVPESPDDLQEAMQALASILARPKDGPAGLPRHLTFVHRRLGEAMAAPLRERGIEVDVVDEHEKFTYFLARLQTMPNPAGPADDTFADDEIPAAADTAAWAAHHRSLLARLDAATEGRELYTRKPLKAFFGDPDLMDELDDFGVEFADGALPHVDAYRDWYVTEYRGKAKQPTIAERLLAGHLPAAERSLLTARIQAHTGLFRIARRQSSLLVLSDILGDFEVEVDDGALAASTTEGQALPARIGNADGYRFVLPLGPLVPLAHVNDVLDDLRDTFGAFTSADLQRRPAMLGALWSWYLDLQESAPPTIHNTDGDPLCFLTGTFVVENWQRFELALAQRPDVDAEEVEGDADQRPCERWVWLRETTTGNTLLASLERVVDQLLVQVNSRQRLDAVRKWLGAIPGVRFVAERERQPDDDGAPNRPPGRGTPLPPEALAQVQAQIDAMTMRWLDERIPALGNRTPREAVRTADGRQTVLELIRSWPDPGGMPGLRTPRERLRRELGLDAESSADG